METIRQLRNQIHDRLVERYSRAVATGIGNKIVDGVDTGEPALIVFVTEKDHGYYKQDSSQMIPPSIDGIPVDVIEVGDIKKLAYTARMRPVVPGFSCSHPAVTAGTLGGVFTDKDGHVVVLSNNHVLANENRGKIGDLIFQPGIADNPLVNKTFIGWDQPNSIPYFASLKDYQTLQVGGKNQHDSAIAKIDESYINQRMVTPNYPAGKPLAGFRSATVGMNVQKFGRTSGQTSGKVLAVGAEFTIGYDIGALTFTDCIVTTSMSKGGDSGSILLDDDMNAIGLLFAGSDKVSLFNPLVPIIAKYGLRVWTPLQQSPAQIWGRTWNRNAYGNPFGFQPNDLLTVEASGNQHAYLETALTGHTQTVTCDVFSGTDGGASWGPGLALQFPRGTLKLNVRRDGGFGGCWAGGEAHGLGKTAPNSWYKLQLSVGSTVQAAAYDPVANVWTKVVEFPYSQTGGPPTALRVGKTDVNGGSGDHPEPGAVGRCQFLNLAVTAGAAPQKLSEPVEFVAV